MSVFKKAVILAVAVFAFGGAPSRALAEPTNSPDWAKIEKQFLKLVREKFDSLSGLDEEKTKLEKTRIVVTDGSFVAGFIALYNDRKMEIDQQTFRETYTALRVLGIPGAKIPEIMAIQYLATIAHELRHAIHNYQRLGSGLTFATIEEEISAITTSQIEATGEILRLYPSAISYSTDLAQEDLYVWESWSSGGPRAVALSAARAYSLKGDHSVLNRKSRSRAMVSYSHEISKVAKLEEILREYENLVSGCDRVPTCLREKGLNDFNDWIKHRLQSEKSLFGAAEIENPPFRGKEELKDYIRSAKEQWTPWHWENKETMFEVELLYKREWCRAWEIYCKQFPDRCAGKTVEDLCAKHPLEKEDE